MRKIMASAFGFIILMVTVVVFAAPVPDTYQTNSLSVLVNGKTCPFFASSPSASGNGDTYTTSKPVEILLEPGAKTIEIETSGRIANCSGCYRTGMTTPYNDYEKYGISLITAPINSLIGVFLDNNNPSYYNKPSRLTNYGSSADNTPELQQAFFIYHFYTSISFLSTIQVPEGATRLYLGGLDTYGWYDNTDNYIVKLTFASTSLIITAGTGTGGTISPSGDVSVAYGADQTFTITPDTDYQVAEVLVDGAPVTIPATGGTYTFINVTANHTISASFNLSWVKVTGFWNNEYDGSFTTIAINPRNPNIIYIGCSMLGGPGVIKSIDGGKTWTETNTGIEKIGVFGTNIPPISKIVISPSNPSILYLGTVVDTPLYKGGTGCVYKSIDGGDTWNKIYSQGSIYDIAVDPQNSDVAFIGATFQGVYKTTNGGNDWVKVYRGTSGENIVDYYNVIRINPTQPNEIYIAAFSYYSEKAIPIPWIYKWIGTIGILPDPLQKSVDGGQTWLNLNPTTISGMPALTDLRVVSSTIYLSTTAYQTPVFVFIDDNGIFKTTDGGTVWKSINDAFPINLTSLPVYSISLDPKVSERLFISSGNGIFYSTDGGEHWGKISGLPATTLPYVVNSIGNRLIALTSSGIYISDVFTTTVKGDVNGDGQVDLADAILCLQVLSGLIPDYINPAADFDGDGKIGMAEAIYAIQKSAGLQ